MAERYSDSIKGYCEQIGISIPIGFFRHPANRYAAIDMGTFPAKLIAKTWSKQEEVLYYLRHFTKSMQLKLLDFKERRELRHSSDGRILPGNRF